MGGRCVGHGGHVPPPRFLKIFNFDHWRPPRFIFLLLVCPPPSFLECPPSFHSHLPPMYIYIYIYSIYIRCSSSLKMSWPSLVLSNSYIYEYKYYLYLLCLTQWRSQDLAQEGGKPLSIIINETHQKL